MFEKKIKKEYLKLAQIIYGGEFYLELKNYRLKEVALPADSSIKQVTDTLLSKNGNDDFYAYKNEKTGFVGNLFENIKTKELVIAYRGTERPGLGENVADKEALLKDVSTDINLITSNFDTQFNDAWDFYKLVKFQNPKRRIVIVGQSLGGALAQIIPAKEYTINRKKVEGYTFNAPGCKHLLDIYDCNTKFNYSFITNYSVMNDWCGMFGEHIGKTYLISPIPINPIESTNTSDIFNNILLTTHEGIFNYTEKLMGKVIRKPSSFSQTEGLSLWFFDKNNPMNQFRNLSEFLSANTGVDLSQMSGSGKTFAQKAGKFLKENLPENIQNSGIAVAIKTAADNIAQASGMQTLKFLSDIDNDYVFPALKTIDYVISGLSHENLDNAKTILKKYVK